MNYITNSKNRKLKHRIRLVFGRIQFHLFHLSVGGKIAFIGIVISLISLFTSWFSTVDPVDSYGAFSVASGYLGYMIVLLDSVTLFTLLSQATKERLKFKTHISVSDSTLITVSGTIMMFLSVAIFNAIRGHEIFFSNISIGKWAVFAALGWVCITAWGILAYAEYKKEVLKRIYVENAQMKESILEEYKDILDKKEEKEDTNMSLPI